MAQSPTVAPNRGALAGIRVLDLIDGPGAYGPKLLAGFGADVIRVEPPGGAPDRGRRMPWPGSQQRDGLGMYFAHYNAGKRSITLDVSRAGDSELFGRLLDTASIVFDNGMLAEAGYAVDELSRRRPPLVIASVTPFGVAESGSPRAHWRGSDLIIQAMSGMIGLFGYKGERPARYGPFQAEEMGGLAAALGALIAWYGSHASGRGDFVDIAMQRVCAMTTFQMANPSLYHQFGFVRVRAERTPGLPGGIYEARDGYFNFNAWRDVPRLVALLDRLGTAPGLRELYDSQGAEAVQRSVLGQDAVATFVACRTRAELTDLVQNEGLMGLPINDARDLLADPFLERRSFFADVEVPGLEAPLRDVGPPVRLSSSPFVAGGRVPLAGEHNGELFAQLAVAGDHSATVDQTAAKGPLAGVRIIDLSWLIAGPLSTRLLADFGADVIKVESRLRMDIGRANRIPLFGVLPGDANTNPDTGGYFHDANASKRSCTLNLASEGGRELLRRLVQVSDVVICNLAGDQLATWGIDYEHARELNPGIIVVNMPSMESSGPRGGWRGFGDTFVGASGLKSISGQPGGPPLPWGHQYADFSSNPFHAAIGIMVALEHRRRTGEGQSIEVSQYESTVALTGPAVLEYQAGGVVPAPPGNRDADACPHNIYRCAGDDSWCAIAVFNDHQWRALVDAAELPELRDERFATVEGRFACEVEIDAALERWTSTNRRQDVADLLQGHGVAAGPLQTTPDLVDHDPFARADQFIELDHPAGRSFLVHRNPLRLRNNPAGTTLAPLIGEHTYAILTEVLNLTSDELADYAAALALE